MEKNRWKDELIEEVENWQVKISWKTIYGGWCKAKGELNNLDRNQTVFFINKVDAQNCSVLFIQNIITELKRGIDYHEDRLSVFIPALNQMSETLKGVKLIRA